MRIETFSYRFAEEIAQHPNHANAWREIEQIVRDAPLFVYPGKSQKNRRLDVVQQVMNAYFDRVFAIDNGWMFHPLATSIENSGLKADYKKTFGNLTVQAEVQFGNMSRWYSDIFKFQTAYSQSLIKLGLSVVPMRSLAVRIDSNVVNFERARRELPSAELSLTLPILMIGIQQDERTRVVDLRDCRFRSFGEINGKGMTENRWRIVEAFLNGTPMSDVGPDSPTGRMLNDPEAEEAE
jgi:hypothetical protein